MGKRKPKFTGGRKGKNKREEIVEEEEDNVENHPDDFRGEEDDGLVKKGPDRMVATTLV